MKNLVLITQVGISLAVPIVLGAYLGSLLDKWLGTKWIFSVVMIIFGVIAGFLNTYKLIMALNDDEKGDDSSGKY